jgi:hypothetical protein
VQRDCVLGACCRGIAGDLDVGTSEDTNCVESGAGVVAQPC